MKKFSLQAETHSNRAGALRGSRPRTEVFEQNYLAELLDHHALHLRSSIFFYFYLDYKHKHTATGQELYALHLPPLPPLKIDYKHKRASALYVWNFFLFF